MALPPDLLLLLVLTLALVLVLPAATGGADGGRGGVDGADWCRCDENNASEGWEGLAG